MVVVVVMIMIMGASQHSATPRSGRQQASEAAEKQSSTEGLHDLG